MLFRHYLLHKSIIFIDFENILSYNFPMEYLVFKKTALPTFVFAGKSSHSSPFKHVERKLNEFELFFVTDGILYLEQSEKVKLTAQSYLIHKKGMVQRGYNSSPSSFYWLHFDLENFFYADDARISDMDEAQRQNYIILPMTSFATVSERLIIFFNQLIDCQFDKNYDALTGHLTAALLSELSVIRIYDDKIKNKRIEEIIAYMRNLITKKVCVCDIARKFNYSEKYFIYLFKKHTGKSPLKFLNENKIILAKKYLSDSSLTIKEIALKCGIENEWYFMRLFKKYEGLTPSTYRNTFYRSYISV